MLERSRLHKSPRVCSSVPDGNVQSCSGSSCVQCDDGEMSEQRVRDLKRCNRCSASIMNFIRIKADVGLHILK